MQLFDDLEDFGAFEPPSPVTFGTHTPSWRGCAASNPCSASTCRRCRTTSQSPCSSSTATTRSSRCCGTTRRSRPPSSSTSSASVRQVRHARDGRARASAIPLARCRGVLAEGARAPAGRSGRTGRQRTDRRVRRAWACRARPGVHLPVPDAGHCRPPGPAPRATTRSSSAGRSRCSSFMSTLSAASPRRWRCRTTSPRFSPRGDRSPATTSSAASHRPRSTGNASRTRRSSRSCDSCFPPASRPRTARPGTCCSDCSPSPSSLDAVRTDRSLIPQAIEEAVRWEAPLLTITRVATRDTELAGVPIPAGSTVMPMLGAANRDEDRYPDPDRFDIFRSPEPYTSFGNGVHVCLGMHLARLEMRVGAQRPARPPARPAPRSRGR